MTRSKPTAVMAMISAEMISVPQAAAGMIGAPFRSAEQLGDRAGVAHGSDGYGTDGGVSGGERLWHALKLPDQRTPAREYVVGCRPDPFQSREHPVEQRDHDR